MVGTLIKTNFITNKVKITFCKCFTTVEQIGRHKDDLSRGTRLENYCHAGVYKTLKLLSEMF